MGFLEEISRWRPADTHGSPRYHGAVVVRLRPAEITSVILGSLQDGVVRARRRSGEGVQAGERLLREGARPAERLGTPPAFDRDTCLRVLLVDDLEDDLDGEAFGRQVPRGAQVGLDVADEQHPVA